MRHYGKGFTAAVGLMCAVLWVAASVAVQAAGPPVFFDADPDPGYQGATVVAEVQRGMIVPVEIFGRNLEGTAGFSAKISFDPDQLSFAGFVASDLIPGFTGMILQDESGMVEVGGASVSGTAAHPRGRLGVVRFEVIAGPAEVSLTNASLTGPEGQMDYDVASTVVIGGSPASPVALDADMKPGYQGGAHIGMVEPGQIISMELVGSELMGAMGFSATLNYDPKEVSFAGFDATELIPGLSGLTDRPQPGIVVVGGASVKGIAMHPGGLLGVVRFEVTSRFSGGTRVSITRAALAMSDGQRNYDVKSSVAVGDARGAIALDLNPDLGDQVQRQTRSVPKAGDTVVVDVVAVEGALGNTGFQVKLKYSASQLEYVKFDPTDVYAGALVILDQAPGMVEASVAIMGGQTSKDAGSLGQATFKVLDGFTGETKVELVGASFDNPVMVGGGGAYVVIGGAVSGPPSPDFDGDGEVGFTDFIMFAQVFGANKGDGRYAAKFDLDQDDNIGFTDFIQFAQAYGKPAPKRARASRPVGLMPGVNGNALLNLAPQAGESFVMAVSLTDVNALQGYEMVLRYDAAALQFVEARRPSDGLLARAGQTPLFLAQQTGPGEVILADAIVDEGRASGSGMIAEVVFRQVAGAEGAVEVEAARLFDGAGGVDLIWATGRFAPPVAALEQNFPNPFNPDTQIAYRIPEETAVRLSVYDVTGQLVQRLVDGVQGPGQYRVVWDARDVAGREVASGIYLYRLEAGSAQMARKMLLVR